MRRTPATREPCARREARFHRAALAHWSRPFVRLMQERAKAESSSSKSRTPSAPRRSSNTSIRTRSAKCRAATGRSHPHCARRTASGSSRCRAASFQRIAATRAESRHNPAARASDCCRAAGEVGRDADGDVRRAVSRAETRRGGLRGALDKGEHFRSGCVWQVGKGRAFYFRPGHETYPVFKQAEPLRVLENAARWLTPAVSR